MKRSLLFCGVAAMALASCTQSEVLDVNGSKAIQFNSFVNNNTRAVTEVSSLNSFYVFGNLGSAEGNYNEGSVYNNEANSVTKYWATGKYYSFGAYADGDGGKLDGAAFDANASKWSIKGYAANDTKDLVVATAKVQAAGETEEAKTVNLTFDHMLSQVKFTFNTTDDADYTLAISNVKVNAVQTADGSYTKGDDATATIAWENGSSSDYTFSDISDVSTDETNKSASTDSKIVIPQSAENLNVTFTATITGAGLNQTANFTAPLAFAVNDQAEANTWVPGYRYNYTATINAETIDPDLEQQKIEFNVTVSDWKDASDKNATAEKQDAQQ